MVRSATDAVKAAGVTTTNIPGMCQKVTRTWFGVASAGDVDGDGDADAVDGWKREPESARHTDRRPPIGAPVAWSGGSGGFGHRAICISDEPDPFIRSTDANGRGKVGNRRLSWFEKNWGLHYLGWSTTMSGVPIPGLQESKPSTKPGPKPAPKKTRGAVVDRVLVDLKKAKAPKGSLRDKQLKLAVSALEKVPFLK